MLTGWLTLTAFLAASANPERAAIGRGALTVAPTRRVKGHPEAELTLNCGDGKNTGVVQYWQTPFGHLQTPGSLGEPDPVFMQGDGSLMIPNTGRLHSGVYYCLLRHAEGTTLWPYELNVEHKRSEAFRFSRDVGLAGAVAASVLLTFVVGFSAGALSRTPVLRCLGAVTTRLRSPRQQRCRTEVTMTTLPPMYDNRAFKMAHDDDDSATTPPPVKPQRSLRQKRQEDATAYLEGCDHMEEEEEAGGSQKERNRGCDGEAEEETESGGFYLEDGGSQRETDEDKCSEDVEEKDGESKEENEGWRRGEVEEDRSKEDGGERRGSAEEEKGRDQEVKDRKKGREEDGETGSSKHDEEEEEEEERDQEEVKDREKRREEDGETGRSKHDEEEEEEGERDQEEVKDREKRREEDGETGRSKHDEEGGDTSSPPGRRSRVIRLYQYDEDGRRFDHLPEAAEPHPEPRLKQRSLSLTRLSAIMAAASAGPLDTRESGRGEERPCFHMEI